MSEKDNHITDLFRRYLKGDITRIEQKALDQKVQEDSYVQDAKEGMDQISKVNATESMNNLDARLKARIQKSKSKRGIGWMSIAAGIAVLVTATLLIWNPFEKNTNVAQSESTVTNEKSAVENNSIERKANDDKDIDFDITVFNQGTISNDEVHTEDLVIAEQKEKVNKPKTLADARQESIDPLPASKRGARNQTNTTNSYYIDGVKVEGNLIPESDNSTKSPVQASPGQIAAQERIADNTKENDKEFQKDIAETEEASVIASSDAIITEDQDLLSSTKVRKAKSAHPKSSLDSDLKTITGIVKDENGEQLIGATIYDIQNGIGTTSNIDGKFTLYVPIDVQELTISYTGYEALIVAIPENNEIIASINQSNAVLSEVAVTGLGSTKNENKSYEASTPINGSSAFKKYIKENLVYPSQATNAGIQGKVVLLFNVDSSGSPIDIEVKKSLGYGCDEEAIRLLKDGPKWTQGTLSEKNSVSIRFK